MNCIQSLFSRLKRRAVGWYYQRLLRRYEDCRTVSLGVKGEDYAAAYVLSKGYEIAGRNWRDGRNEVDLIAWDGETLVFIEVKTRADEEIEPPERNVNNKKQRRILCAADSYCRLHVAEINGAEVRFDVAAIIWSPGQSRPSKIRYWKSAFGSQFVESFLMNSRFRAEKNSRRK